MLELLFKLSDKFNINPFVMFGLVFLFYGFKINDKLHRKKDEEIENLKKENKKLRDKQLEYEIKKSMVRQTEMLNKN